MKSEVRRMFDELCLEFGQLFQPTFDVPSTLHFGDAPDEGTSTKLARADHVHGMPPSPDDFLDSQAQSCFSYVEWMMKSGADNTHVKLVGTTQYGDGGIAGVGDNPGPQGSFGHLLCDNSAAGVNAFGIQISAAATLDITTATHGFGRLTKFLMRARASVVGASPAQNKTILGGFTCSSGADVATYTDGAFFYIAVDGSGVGNFHCVVMSGGVGTDIDTGRGWAFSSDGEFENFIIEYDLTTVTFTIGATVYAQITDNIPTSVATWGVGSQQTAAAPALRRVVCDDLIFAGRR